MFAVLKTGGKQYKVQSGDVLRVEKLAADAGEKIQFNEILMVGAQVGTPTVEGAAVQAEVIDQIKGDKLIHFVKRRRKHGSQRTKGHRQQLTLLRVTDILEKGADKSGVKAAVGAGSVAAISTAAPAKKAEPKKAAPKKAEAQAAKPAPKAEAPAAAADDLTSINGIGPAAAKRLADAGITSFAQLAALDVETFDAVKVKPDWVEQAKDLAKK
ncbi:MAG: 50S ribosomal protein L21 [Paracoccaceae bacterium]